MTPYPAAGRALGRRLGPWILLLVAIAWGVAGYLGGRRPEPDLLPFLKRAYPMASYDRLQRGGRVVRRGDEVLGFGAAASAGGYGGPITVAVAVSPAGTLDALAILEYRDTPGLRESLQPLLASLVGRDARAPFEIGRDLDAVTGATFSSLGVAAAVRGAAGRVAERATGSRAGSPFGWPEAVLLALFGVAWAARHERRIGARPRTAIRWTVLLASLATLGVVWNRPWTLAFPLRLLSGDWPDPRGHLYWYLLLVALLVGFDRSGRSPWCPWLCPFGAAQDLVGRVGGACRRRIPSRTLFAWAKRLLLVAAVALGLLYRSPGAASFEVFAALFRWTGSGYQMGILFFVGITALFFSRPYCHWLCPVDVLERSLASARLAALRALGRSAPAPPARGSAALPVVGRARPRDPVRVFRDNALTAVGLLCVGLVIAHLATGFRAMSSGSQLGLMSETFVSRKGGR